MTKAEALQILDEAEAARLRVSAHGEIVADHFVRTRGLSRGQAVSLLAEARVVRDFGEICPHCKGVGRA